MNVVETLCAAAGAEAHDSRRGSLLAVVGGKGGVGKTNVALNVAVAASHIGSNVLLVDGDLGLANVDVLLGLAPARTVAHVLSGECNIADAILAGPAGLDILPAASARMDLAGSRPAELADLLAALVTAGHAYDLIVVDVGAGIGPAVVSIASVCDRAWLVTTPEPTSMTDAYGTLKVLKRAAPGLPVELLVNAASDASQVRDTHSRLEQVSMRFLDSELPLLGSVPRDPRVGQAVSLQKPLVEQFPTSPAARRMIELASNLISDLPGSDRARTAERTWRRVPS